MFVFEFSNSQGYDTKRAAINSAKYLSGLISPIYEFLTHARIIDWLLA
jgi:hypothetical protein